MMNGLFLRPVSLALAALLCASCGGSDTPSESDPQLTIDSADVAVRAGSSVQVRIDVIDYTDSRGIAGYQTTFDEAGTGIAISTSDCVGAGTRWCKEWTITPAPGTLAGEYSGSVRAFGNLVPVAQGRLTVNVLPGPSAQALPALVVDGTDEFQPGIRIRRTDQATLVIAQDLQLWGAGSNQYGQLRSAAYNLGFDGRVDVQPAPVQPEFIEVAQPLTPHLAPVANEGGFARWTALASGPSYSIALRGDGSVWAWGLNTRGKLGFEADPASSNIQLKPRAVPGLSDIRAISTLRRHGLGASLALAGDGTVFAWGGNSDGPDLAPLQGARQVPASIDANGVRLPMTDVRAIAGGSDQSGSGSAAVVKGDGTVWTWGRAGFASGLPRQVSDLPASAIAVAMADRGERSGIGLALLGDGRVFSFPSDGAAGEAPPAAAPVDGLSDVQQIAAGAEFAYARTRDGRVLRWRPGIDAPRAIDGLANVVSIGVAHAIVDEACQGAGGSVWRIDAAGRVFRVAEFSGIGCARAFSTLSVVKAGSGSGNVSSDSGNIDCGAFCSNAVPRGRLVQLHELPSFGANATWSGTGCDAGVVWMTEDRSCTVSFDPVAVANKDLTLQIVGQGRVSSSKPGIDCPGDCSESWPQGTEVALRAMPASGWVFDRYSGDTDCADGVLAIGRNKDCVATFVLPGLLQIQVTGSGVVRGAGIDCGIDCQERFAAGTAVQLQAAPAPGWRFAGFTGDSRCGSGNFTMSTADLSCNARFELDTPPPAPFGLSASATGTSVELRWSRNSGVGSYELTRTPGVAGQATRTVVFSGPADSYLDTAVAGATTYRYELVAYNSGGASPPASVFATTLVADNWTRVGSADIDARAAFAQPALAIAPDGNTVAVAQVFPDAGLARTQVFTNDVFAPNPWTRLAGTPGDALTPAAASNQPAVAIDSQGVAFVAWTQTTAGGIDVRVARYDSAAAQWVLIGDALDHDLGSAALNDALQPELVLDASDRPVVAWLQGGGAYVKRWNGSAWVAVGGSPGTNVNAVKLMLDGGGSAHLLLRRGSGGAAQLFAYRESLGSWSALGGALNAPLGGFRDSLPFFGLATDVDGSPLAVWSEGSLAYVVHASRWRNGAWQALRDVASETGYAITGLAVARSVQAPALSPTPPVVMLTRQPIFVGANPRNAYGDVFLLQNDAWTTRPTLNTFGPMLGLTLRVTRLATPIAAWLAETGSLGSGELRLFVWRGL